MKTYVHQTLVQLFIAAYFVTAKKWKPKCPSINEWINTKQNAVYPYNINYSAIKRVPLHVSYNTINLENIMLSE